MGTSGQTGMAEATIIHFGMQLDGVQIDRRNGGTATGSRTTLQNA